MSNDKTREFNRAISELRAVSADCSGTRTRRFMAGVVLDALLTGERFFVPETGYIIRGKECDKSVRDSIILPFPLTVLLEDTSELCRVRPNGLTALEQGFVLSIGATPESEFCRKHKLLEDAEWPSKAFAVLGAFRSDSRGWIPQPGFVCANDLDVDDGTPLGLNIAIPAPQLDQEEILARSNKIRGVERSWHSTMQEAMSGHVRGLANLCVMLSLHNVSSERISFDEINKKRERKNRLPLYSYKILVVDGEKWSSRSDHSGLTGRGVRSHMRRGHIRRLPPDGLRRVWVRSTFVHGSVHGFVDKDYAVKGAQ